jgi:polar amino acid transport system substrate-binding protein
MGLIHEGTTMIRTLAREKGTLSPHTSARPPRQKLVLSAVALVTAGLLAACGATSATPSDKAPVEPVAGASQNALGFDQALHDQLPEEIKAAGKIRIGIDPTFAPMEFTDEDNNIVGSDPELIEAMGEVLGVEIEYVTTKFAALIPSLNSGRFDVGMNMGDYLKREKEVDFLNFFLAKRAFLVTAAADDIETVTDLCGLTVAVLQGADAQDKLDEANTECADEGLEPIMAQAFPSNNEAVLALGNGRIDASFSDTPSAGYAALQSEGKFKTTGTGVYDKPPYFGMVLPKESPLMPALEGALNAVIDSGRYEEIFTKWGLEDGLIEEAVINGAKE